MNVAIVRRGTRDVVARYEIHRATNGSPPADGEYFDTAWQRAVDLKPDLRDALWNLGVKAAQHGRPQQARAALERFVAGAPGERYAGDVRKARGMLEGLK